MNFGVQVISQFLQEEAANGSNNVLGSPLSINLLLNMVAAGSTGPTQDQFLQFLKAKALPDLNAKSSKLLDVANPPPRGEEAVPPRYDPYEFAYEFDEVVGEGPTISFVNGIWLDKTLGLKPSYEEIVRDVYKAQAQSVDFRDEAAKVADEVNSWAEKNTNGVIKDILPRNLRNDTLIVLANALYFKGDWSQPFEKSNTQEKDFYLINGQTVLVPYLSEAWTHKYYTYNEEFKVLKLPYQVSQDKTRRFSMYIFLPHERNGLHNLIQKHFTANPESALKKFRPEFKRLRELRIPKFKFLCTLEPVKVMEELGLTLPFRDFNEDFNGIADSPFIFRNMVMIQKSGIEVNEDGTEAACISEMCVITCPKGARPPPPEDFVADHPFAFMIREEKSGVILFLGAVLNPLV